MKTIAMLAALTLTIGLAAAKGPSLPPPNPEQGSLAITLDAKPPAKIGKMQADQIFFVHLDSDADPSSATAIFPSNYSDGDHVYLLNAKPGRYVAVVAKLRNPMSSGREFQGFLSQEAIAQTETTVAAGRMAFMGKFSVQTSTKLDEADPAQAHYFRLLMPETGRLMQAMSGSMPYTAKLTKFARDPKAAEAFWTEATKDAFKNEPAWLELARHELEELKK